MPYTCNGNYFQILLQELETVQNCAHVGPCGGIPWFKTVHTWVRTVVQNCAYVGYSGCVPSVDESCNARSALYCTTGYSDLRRSSMT